MTYDDLLCYAGDQTRILATFQGLMGLFPNVDLDSLKDLTFELLTSDHDTKSAFTWACLNGLSVKCEDPSRPSVVDFERLHETLSHAPAKLEIKEGRYYLTRGGTIHGPIERNPDSLMYLYGDGDRNWLESGKYLREDSDHPKDLVAEIAIEVLP